MIFLHRQNDPENIAFKNIDGIEIDIRSYGDRLVLRHDRLHNNEIDSNSSDLIFLEDYICNLKKYTVIVNVKESSLEEQISKILEESNIKYYFLDSQIPDIIRLSKQEKYKGKFIIRVSDYETLNYKFLLHCKPEFIWVDYDFDNFNLIEYIEFLKKIDSDEYLNQNRTKKILVSPELYGLQYINITRDIIKITNKELLKKYSVCTKLPDDWRKIV